MPEFYAIIVICGLLGPCGQVREQYISIESCKADKEQLSKIYKTDIIYCIKGNITDDRWKAPDFALHIDHPNGMQFSKI